MTLIWSNAAGHGEEGEARDGYTLVYIVRMEQRETKGVDPLMSNNRAHLSTPAWPAEVQKVAPPSPRTRPLRAARITPWSWCLFLPRARGPPGPHLGTNPLPSPGPFRAHVHAHERTRAPTHPQALGSRANTHTHTHTHTSTCTQRGNVSRFHSVSL